MERIVTAVLILVGLINFYPIIGVISNEMISGLYQIDVPQNDVLILLRHRAILFGLLGAFIIYSAFKPELQWSAIIVGLISMLSFVAVAWLVGDYGSGVRKIIVADVIASAALFVVACFRFWFIKL